MPAACFVECFAPDKNDGSENPDRGECLHRPLPERVDVFEPEREEPDRNNRPTPCEIRVLFPDLLTRAK